MDKKEESIEKLEALGANKEIADNIYSLHGHFFIITEDGSIEEL